MDEARMDRSFTCSRDPILVFPLPLREASFDHVALSFEPNFKIVLLILNALYTDSCRHMANQSLALSWLWFVSICIVCNKYVNIEYWSKNIYWRQCCHLWSIATMLSLARSNPVQPWQLLETNDVEVMTADSLAWQHDHFLAEMIVQCR